jgi:hydrogenase maturation protease
MFLIICYGNPICGDDGVGWVMGQRLAGKKLPAHARVVVCHQLTPDLAEPISQAARVVFVDARLKGNPGEVTCTRLEPGEVFLDPIGHSAKPHTLLGLSRWLYGKTPEALIVSVAGTRFKPGEPFSPEVERVLPRMTSRVRACLTACGP